MGPVYLLDAAQRAFGLASPLQSDYYLTPYTAAVQSWAGQLMLAGGEEVRGCSVSTRESGANKFFVLASRDSLLYPAGNLYEGVPLSSASSVLL